MKAALTWVQERLVTTDAVYGLILYSALIAVVSNDHGNSLSVFLVSAFSLLVFWGAHVYAGTITNHGIRDGQEVKLTQAFHEAIADASGMLFAAIFPSIVLLLGAIHVILYQPSVDSSLYVVLVMLALIGYRSFTLRKSKIVVRIFGAIGTAAFGLVMIILNTIVH